MENSKIFVFNWVDVKSAVVSGLLMGLLVIVSSVIASKSIYNLDWANLIDIGIMAFLTSMVSLIKSILTSSSGSFAGLTKIK